MIGEAIQTGIEPPEELIPGVLLAGKVTHMFGETGHGKTMFALGLVKDAIERGHTVMYLDEENGTRTVAERLRDLGADPQLLDERLYYIPSPGLTLGAQDVREYAGALDEIKPALVVFDSWINYLASAGLDENSANDIARWAICYTHSAKRRGIAVLVLDHVPYDARRSRGSTRKKDEVDVQWHLKKTQEFSRSSVGEIVLVKEKDREGYLPPSATFSLGGTPDGCLFRRSEGTVEVPARRGFTPKQRELLALIREKFGMAGATFTEWHVAAECSQTTLSKAIALFRKLDLIVQIGDRYIPVGAEEEVAA